MFSSSGLPGSSRVTVPWADFHERPHLAVNLICLELGSEEIHHSSVALKSVPCSITMLPLPIPSFWLDMTRHRKTNGLFTLDTTFTAKMRGRLHLLQQDYVDLMGKISWGEGVFGVRANRKR